MTNHYGAGRRREYLFRDWFAERGWEPVNRSSSSKGVCDLVMAHEQHGGAFIQVGGKSKTIGPEARTKFVRLATISGALPLLATPVRGGWDVWVVGLGPASTWERWAT